MSSSMDHESSRIEALKSTALLDTPPEEVFDRFTALASQILGIPVAIVSLIDENRQFFKSQVGLPAPFASLRQTPLSHSFCRHVVDSQMPLIISDARLNDLVSQNPAIEEIGIVAYAGIPLVTPNGETIGSFCAIDNQPHIWTDYEVGVITGLAQAVMVEISLRVSAQELRNKAERVEGILESITDAFFQLDSNWTFTYINEQALTVLRRPRQDLLGKNVWEEFPDAVGSNFDRQYRWAVQSGKPVIFEEYFSPLNVWLEIHAYPGEEGLAVYFQDVTPRKKSEERLLLLESVVVHSNDTVIITEARPIDEPGPRILYVNAAFTHLTGYTSEEVLGRSPRFLQGPETSREPLDELRKAVEVFQPVSVEVLNYRKDSSIYWAEMSLVPVGDGSGLYTHWISIQRDVTERRRLQQVLQAAKNESDDSREEANAARAEAERANLAKSEFLSRMSHELRTPLNAILGFGQLLEMRDFEEEDQECVDQMMKGGRHLLRLINEVLDIARIEAGQISLSLEPVQAKEICSEVLALVRAMAAQYNVTLRNENINSLWHVLADQQRLKQILLNLLSNAIKYNRSGGSVSMTCERVSQDKLRFGIHDEGPGIAFEKQHRLFRPFDRLDIEQGSSTDKVVEGTGIGLALSRSLAEAMNGSLNFQSEMGQGSTFWVELPITQSSMHRLDDSGEEHDTILSAAGQSEAPSLKVLYIEDNLANLKLVERLLERRPVELLSTQQGQLGLDLASQHLPTLILLDLNLPDISGLKVLQRLREEPQTQDIPVVMLSADASPGQIQRLLAAGAQSYLTKPIDVREFYHTVDLLLKKES
jgi:PAS domain S-box-containing protein